MPSEFQQEVETEETANELHRMIWKLEMDHGKENLDLLITLNPDFQIKVETLTTVNLYGKKHKQTCLGWPWCTEMGQEEPYKIWKRV